MSELTQCNYCLLKHIKKRAKEKRMKVTVRATNWGLGGFDVFMHPKDIVIDPKNVEQRNQYFQSWMMEITDHCVC